MRVFDFCGQSSPAKSNWTREATALETAYWFRPTARGRLLHFLQMSVKPPLKKAVPAWVLRHITTMASHRIRQ